MRWTTASLLLCLVSLPAPASSQPACGPPAGRRIAVAPQTSLQVVEWGGSGETILFLSGAAAPAASYDDFAPLFTDAYRVVGMTRRGVSPSDPSRSGYAPATLTADVLAVMDSLGIRSAHLVGWSFGGLEAVWVAVAHPERVRSVTLLDSYDFPPLDIREPTPTPFTPYDSTSPLALAWRLRRLGQPPYPLTTTCALFRFSPDGRYQGRATPSSIADSLVRGMSRLPYHALTQPVLAIFAVARGVGDLYPSYATMGADDRAAADSMTRGRTRASAALRERVRRELPRATIIEVPGAAHAIFASHSAITYVAMRRFLEQLHSSARPPL